MSFDATITPHTPIGVVSGNPIILFKFSDEFRSQTSPQTATRDSELYVKLKPNTYYAQEGYLYIVADGTSGFYYENRFPHNSENNSRRFSGRDGKGLDCWEFGSDTNRFNDAVATFRGLTQKRTQGLLMLGWFKTDSEGYYELFWGQGKPTDFQTGLMKGSMIKLWEIPNPII